MDLNPKDYRAWYGLGQTYELLHMPVYALHYYQRATQVMLCTINQWALQVALLHVLALRQQQRIANDNDAFRGMASASAADDIPKAGACQMA